MDDLDDAIRIDLPDLRGEAVEHPDEGGIDAAALSEIDHELAPSLLETPREEITDAIGILVACRTTHPDPRHRAQAPDSNGFFRTHETMD